MKRAIILLFLQCSVLIYGEDELYSAVDLLKEWQQVQYFFTCNQIQNNIAICRGWDYVQVPCTRQVYQKNNTQNSSLTSVVSISVIDNKISCSQGFGIFWVLLDFINMIKTYKQHNDMVYSLTYQEFVERFPHLLFAEYHIMRVQKMLNMSRYGTFPEKIIARINLSQSSLFAPYHSVMNGCAKKILKSSFTKQLKFVWKENDVAADAYQKFYKKVPQHWRKIAYCLGKLPKEIAQEYQSEWACKIKNEYNQTLLDMVYAGIDENFPLLKQLCRKYYDALTKKLYRYYINQNIKKYHQEEESEMDDPDDIEVNQKEIEEQKEEIVLREFYKKELSQWLLSESQNSCEQDKKCADLPLHPNYRFILLKNFIEKICKGSETSSDIFEEFFVQSGVLKKYKEHSYVKKYVQNDVLQDSLLHKAVNFSLAIMEKEGDEITQSLSKLICQHVALVFENRENIDMYEKYYKKIAEWYAILSCRKYDQVQFDI